MTDSWDDVPLLDRPPAEVEAFRELLAAELGD